MSAYIMPLRPEEIRARKSMYESQISPRIINVLNNHIQMQYDVETRRAIVLLDDALKIEIMRKMGIGDWGDVENFQNQWLNVEDVFESSGWRVERNETEMIFIDDQTAINQEDVPDLLLKSVPDQFIELLNNIVIKFSGPDGVSVISEDILNGLIEHMMSYQVESHWLRNAAFILRKKGWIADYRNSDIHVPKYIFVRAASSQ